jgi:hypothetical protein
MKKQSIINEYFNPGVLLKLADISDSFDIPDNNLRADAMMDVLRYEGFIELGCGTNRLVVSKEDCEYAFKLALDARGVIDNNVEFHLSDDLNDYVAKNYENGGLISVAERVRTMTSEMFESYENEISDILNIIAKTYIINDIGPKSFLNWGLNKDEVPVVLDYAYLSRIDEANITECDCGGNLKYTDDFSEMICDECDKIYQLSEIAGDVIDPLIEMGFTTPDTKRLKAKDENYDESGFYNK